MNNETAIVVGLVLALMIIASVFAATGGTIDLADQAFDDISGEQEVPEITESGFEPGFEGGEKLWRKEQHLSRL